MKQKHYWGILLLSGCVTLSMATLAWTDEDERWEHERGEHGFIQQTAGVSPVSNPAYKTECSACHFAYPAGFLPERSWVKIMNNLDDHFGENAELNAQTKVEIENYLRGHAADRIPNRFGRSILRSVDAGATPLRISETGYFQHKHREIPSRMVAGNPKVGSFSNCLSCHSMADRGSFDEHGVSIPGFGRWED
ncbi:MAG: diacylglycerol kinase [Zetaproteobacteria bacterium CG12_big_fil_rev_8_21_14_0_65_54_13]|nr:MAG: diacylglycerol kinase [Zetaproteobacteria bacterium CG23_combo_of_CG06-09_8_20_14_all_54_7]PIW47966.1 MAG: diacylglycerol kinase [Zetaproteobacteria bacterium CG12_big_fil_rev_8_21_14_0_65_54_13]PIX54698.1 MAG: diacylglycerol kinase [Zetaproteobacteria bacterium CG_4_10_14_3_um_filter_54_28]PJA30957.1 MAG: diacylglycerol kinase [Zetaproteobacteria bacterium CG_4_9_14_3_um_filter_54_145]